MSELKSEFLFEMFAALDAPIDVGLGPEGHRMIILTTGGSVKGPKINGEVMAGTGGDWARIRPDGIFVLDVRVCLKTDDGEIIYMTYSGRAHFESPEQMGVAMDFMRDDPVSGENYYFRTNPVFETSSEAYAWLNGVVAVGIGELGRGGVTYQVHAIT